MAEEWGPLFAFAERLTVIGLLGFILFLIISDHYIVTRARMQEWKDRALSAEERERAAEKALRENTAEITRVAQRVEEGNRLMSELVNMVVRTDRRR